MGRVREPLGSSLNRELVRANRVLDPDLGLILQRLNLAVASQLIVSVQLLGFRFNLDFHFIIDVLARVSVHAGNSPIFPLLLLPVRKSASAYDNHRVFGVIKTDRLFFQLQPRCFVKSHFDRSQIKVIIVNLAGPRAAEKVRNVDM